MDRWGETNMSWVYIMKTNIAISFISRLQWSLFPHVLLQWCLHCQYVYAPGTCFYASLKNILRLLILPVMRKKNTRTPTPIITNAGTRNDQLLQKSIIPRDVRVYTSINGMLLSGSYSGVDWTVTCDVYSMCCMVFTWQSPFYLSYKCKSTTECHIRIFIHIYIHMFLTCCCLSIWNIFFSWTLSIHLASLSQMATIWCSALFSALTGYLMLQFFGFIGVLKVCIHSRWKLHTYLKAPTATSKSEPKTGGGA